MRSQSISEARMEALREQVVRGCLENMTQHIEKKLHQHRLQLLKRAKVFDEAEWYRFLSKLSKGDERFIWAWLPEIHDRLYRIVEDQPLGALIRARGGHWPDAERWREAIEQVTRDLIALHRADASRPRVTGPKAVP